MKKAFFILSLLMVLSSCKSVSNPKRAINDSGMMYAMVYDYENNPVSGAAVFIDEKKYMESDLQGRFILEFKKGGEYAIRVEKQGYEIIEDTFTYDPMSVLYFKMINATQLLSQAEEAIDQYLYSMAETIINRALLLEPNRPDVLYLQCVVYYFQGRKNDALLILKNLEEIGFTGEYISEFIKKLTN